MKVNATFGELLWQNKAETEVADGIELQRQLFNIVCAGTV